MSELAAAPADTRPYSPGLEGVIAGETALSYIDGERGRLLYRGYPIGDLVRNGSYASVAELLWTGDWDPDAKLACRPVPDAVLQAHPRAAEDGQADGRAPDRGLRVGRGARSVVAADAR